jgi:hypothetical protein
VKEIIIFATRYKAARTAGEELPSVSYGVGMTVVMVTLLFIASLGLHHYQFRATSTGVHVRAAIISAVYERAMRLTGRARIEHTNGKMVNYISVDSECKTNRVFESNMFVDGEILTFSQSN